MTFSDRPFEQRFGAMGDEAEGMFEATATRKFERYGLNRPAVRMSDLPPFIRYTPDYLMGKCLVEVQGFGRDQTIKLKDDKCDALDDWSRIHPVMIFLWDSSNRRHTTISLDHLREALAVHGFAGAFDDGKNPFMAVRADLLGEVEEVVWTYV